MNNYSYEQLFQCGANIEEGTCRPLLRFSFNTGESDKTGDYGEALQGRHECDGAFGRSWTRSEHDISQSEEVGAL
jgi:hypothetical protein